MLSLTHLTKDFGAVGAVRGISLEISRGEFISIVGPSGCGKTTLLRLIAGFEHPTAGTVFLDGRDITTLAPQARRIGMVFQNYALFPHMTVRENIAFGLAAQKRGSDEIAQRVGTVAERVRLSHKLDVAVPLLSGGEQQRVALARAIVTEPALLLLDEPLSNLDQVLREEMRNEIARVQRETGLTTVYVTHDQGEALSLADRIAVLRAGQVEQFAAPREIFFQPANAFVASFMGNAQLLQGTVANNAGTWEVLVEGGMIIPLSGHDHAGMTDDMTVVVAIKPEAVRFVQRGSAGVVRDRAFTGGMTEYAIDMPTCVLRARLPSTSDGAYAPGTPVHVDIDPHLCNIFRA